MYNYYLLYTWLYNRLFSHVDDPFLDEPLPREYVLYLRPSGPLQNQLSHFWQQSRVTCGKNKAHNIFPHITLCQFFMVSHLRTSPWSYLNMCLLTQVIYEETSGCRRASRWFHDSEDTPTPFYCLSWLTASQNEGIQYRDSKANNWLTDSKFCKNVFINLCNCLAVAQEVLYIYRRLTGCWFKLRSHLAKCLGVPEQDAWPQFLPTSWLLPCMVDTAIGVWMCEWMGECEAIWKAFCAATGLNSAL